jgi:hypothetical protein
MARVEFETPEDLDRFDPPPFVVIEVTNNPFFLGESLVSTGFDGVRAEVAKLGNQIVESKLPDE